MLCMWGTMVSSLAVRGLRMVAAHGWRESGAPTSARVGPDHCKQIWYNWFTLCSWADYDMVAVFSHQGGTMRWLFHANLRPQGKKNKARLRPSRGGWLINAYDTGSWPSDWFRDAGRHPYLAYFTILWQLWITRFKRDIYTVNQINHVIFGSIRAAWLYCYWIMIHDFKIHCHVDSMGKMLL